MRRVLRIVLVILLLLLIYVAVGTFLFPVWWYPILVEHHLSFAYVVDGFAGAARIYYLAFFQTLIIVLTVVLVSRTHMSKKLRTWTASVWKGTTFFWMSAALGMFLLILIIVGASGLDERTREDRDLEVRLEQARLNMNKLDAEIEKSQEEAKRLVPLTIPTNFLYLDKDAADSLYGQYEPDLVPALVMEELQESSELKGKISINDYITTEAGKKELSSKMTEYRSVVKNPERKLKDLVIYLYDKNKFITFRDIQPKSETLAELDKAIRMLEQKHELKVDAAKLQTARAKFLSQELELTESQLRALKGLTLVEGTWVVSIQNGTLTLDRPFVDVVPNSPKCEVQIRTSDISPRDLEIISKLPTKSMHLSVFGNALMGVTDTSRTVLLKPVAIW